MWLGHFCRVLRAERWLLIIGYLPWHRYSKASVNFRPQYLDCVKYNSLSASLPLREATGEPSARLTKIDSRATCITTISSARNRLIELNCIFAFSFVNQSAAQSNVPVIREPVRRFGAVFVEDENEIDPAVFQSTHSKRDRRQSLVGRFKGQRKSSQYQLLIAPVWEATNSENNTKYTLLVWWKGRRVSLFPCAVAVFV